MRVNALTIKDKSMDDEKGCFPYRSLKPTRGIVSDHDTPHSPASNFTPLVNKNDMNRRSKNRGASRNSPKLKNTSRYGTKKSRLEGELEALDRRFNEACFLPYEEFKEWEKMMKRMD